MSEWIKCTEMWPPVEEEVLVITDRRGLRLIEVKHFIVQRADCQEYECTAVSSNGIEFIITHWMEIPEFPGEE